ncbi:MAG: hypothetical protein J5736_04405, partial [Bacilli bacterium]|nr:hypothetical protein [Bacilli bacterium]
LSFGICYPKGVQGGNFMDKPTWKALPCRAERKGRSGTRMALTALALALAILLIEARRKR